MYLPGSVKKGEALVTRVAAGRQLLAGPATARICKGLGPVPGIAGRSPSYLARQLYDMQQGNRHGVWTELMKPVVAKLTNDDMVAIVAYIGFTAGWRRQKGSHPRQPIAIAMNLKPAAGIQPIAFYCILSPRSGEYQFRCSGVDITLTERDQVRRGA